MKVKGQEEIDRANQRQAEKVASRVAGQIQELRWQGIEVAEGTPATELERLSRIASLRHRAIGVSLKASTTQLDQLEAQCEGFDSFFTKVAGVSHRNDDRTSRQRIIRQCEPREQLVLDHDEGNRYDPNAVRVCRQNGEKVGFLNADLAERVVRHSAEGYRYAAFVANVTGGTEDAPILGMNLLIVVADPGVTNERAQAYANLLDFGRDQGMMEPASRQEGSGCASVFIAVVLLLSGIAYGTGQIETGFEAGPHQSLETARRGPHQKDDAFSNRF